MFDVEIRHQTVHVTSSQCDSHYADKDRAHVATEREWEESNE